MSASILLVAVTLSCDSHIHIITGLWETGSRTCLSSFAEVYKYVVHCMCLECTVWQVHVHTAQETLTAIETRCIPRVTGSWVPLKTPLLTLLIFTSQFEGTTDLLFITIINYFAFSRIVLYKWNHKICVPFCLGSFTQRSYLTFIPSIAYVNSSFPFIIVYSLKWIYYKLFSHLVMGIWAISRFWLLPIKLQWASVDKSLYGVCFHFHRVNN